MRQLIVIYIFGIILAGCEQQKERLEELVFDNSQIAHRDTHQYTFDKSGRIKVDRKTSYRCMAGVPFDSTISETIFNYNDNGKLLSAIDLSDSSRQVKIYNHQDSLVGDYHINQFGDTTRLNETFYEGNKVIRKFDRHLSLKLADYETFKKEDLRNYDTMMFFIDLIYDKGVHVKSLVTDKEGRASEEIEYYYTNGKCIKTVTYAFLGDAKYLKETTYYQSAMENDPDNISIGSQGDTIALVKTVRKSDGKMILSYVKELDMQDISYYNMRGQLVAIVAVDIKAQEKTVTRYTYDIKGNIIEEISYRERVDKVSY